MLKLTKQVSILLFWFFFSVDFVIKCACTFFLFEVFHDAFAYYGQVGLKTAKVVPDTDQ